jgi:hypothetical protein
VRCPSSLNLSLTTLRSDTQTTLIQQLYIIRLEQPHAGIEETFSQFSTFISTRFPDSMYEDLMVEANSIYAASKETYTRREPKELELKAANYSVDAYLSYIAYERTGKKANTPEAITLAKNLFERAVADHPDDWTVWEAYLQLWKDRLAIDLQGDDEEAIAESLFELRAVVEKAVRFVPGTSEAWINLMRLEEREGSAEAVEATFQKALSTGLLSKSVEELVKLYIAWADFQRRLFEFMGVLALTLDGRS